MKNAAGPRTSTSQSPTPRLTWLERRHPLTSIPSCPLEHGTKGLFPAPCSFSVERSYEVTCLTCGRVMRQHSSNSEAISNPSLLTTESSKLTKKPEPHSIPGTVWEDPPYPSIPAWLTIALVALLIFSSY